MDPFSSGAGAATGAIEFIKQVDDLISGADSYLGGKSLIDVTRHGRVEPLFIVDADLQNYEHMSAISQTMLSIFSGFYLQAVEILSNIGKVTVAQKLAPLNPSRKTDIGLLSHDTYKLAAESYTHALPLKKNREAVALEDSVNTNDQAKNLIDQANLSVGRMYDVKLKGEEEDFSVKVAIRLLAKVMPTTSLAAMLTSKGVMDHDLVERFHGWRAGRLGFIRDLLLCQDLIEKHRNASIKDKTGTYDEIITRKNDAIRAGLLERNPSMAIASNLCVISSETMDQVEARMMGDMTSQKVRKALFEATNMMVLAVVDRGYERITFYYRGIPQSSTLSIRDIKGAAKNGGTDVLDIMKAFMAGHTPSL